MTRGTTAVEDTLRDIVFRERRRMREVPRCTCERRVEGDFARRS